METVISWLEKSGKSRGISDTEDLYKEPYI